MDNRIGPERGYGMGCGFTRHPTHATFCGKKPVVRHFLFNEKVEDDSYPSGFTCDEHINSVPMDLILMAHAVGYFCELPNSRWSFAANECVMDVEEYELILLGTNTLGDDIIQEFAEEHHAKN